VYELFDDLRASAYDQRRFAITPAGVAMSYATTRHGDLFYTTVGAGRPLVLLHGNTMTAASQSRLAQRFADEHEVTSVDLLGHGHSARPAGLFSADYFRMQGEALTDLLAARFPDQPVAVFGMSAGALSALNAACVAPERIAALVLDGVIRQVDPAIVATNRESVASFSPEWNRYLQSQHGDWWPELRAGVVATMEQLEASGTDIIPCLESITSPALIFQGGKDRFCPEAQGRAIAAAMPNARLVYDAEAGHLLAWKNPAAFREIVREFLHQVL
jgi:pimeloyl-ACP methyl ester carboxylesterase